MSNGRTVSILHRIPGRLRLGVEALRDSPARAERIAERARAAPGVRAARANVGAASLVIEYDTSLPLRELLVALGRIAELSECASLDPEAAPPPAPQASGRTSAWTARKVLEAAHKVNAASAMAVPHVDLKILVPGALAGYGAFRLLTASGAATPHWVVFFMYGLDAFVSLNRGAVDRWLAEAAPPAAEGARP